ncbi:MAG: flavin-containing monooxygenase [Pirellulales bacterium]
MPASAESPICVIGAGSSGLVAAKNLRQQGFAVEVLERENDLGGNWNYALPCSRVYRSTHMISSRRFTQYPDFPMPREFPQYPRHDQVLAYLRSYAQHFALAECIRYQTAVEEILPVDDGNAWQVRTASSSNGTNNADGPVVQTRQYSAVVIANGHHWSPRQPQYPGEFHGHALHSAAYKTPDILQGRRVLVVGGGNSGCDIAVEAAQHNAVTFHSTRRGYRYIPKWIFGSPSDVALDQLHAWHVPLWLRRILVGLSLRIAVGPQSRYRLRLPDHRLFESHPVVNSLLPYYAGQGDIRPKPDIARLERDRVVFVDGTVEPIDVIVYATGYNLEFPFIDRQWLNWRDGRPGLHLHLFHPTFDNLFVAGMIQPDSGIFSLVDWQTQAIALFLAAVRDGRPAAAWMRGEKAAARPPSAGIHYTDSPRHSIEVEHWSYMKTLKKLIRRLR